MGTKQLDWHTSLFICSLLLCTNFIVYIHDTFLISNTKTGKSSHLNRFCLFWQSLSFSEYIFSLQMLCSVAHSRLIRVCHVDYDRDIALVALDKSSSTDKIVAAARLTKEHHHPKAAEFSILVADDYQGEGLGEKILRELIEHGKAEGLDAIEAVVLQTNRAMIHVADKCGFENMYDREEGVVKQFLNLRHKQKEDLNDVKLRRLTAPVCI